MANHQSAIKSIRKNEKRRIHNKYYARTTRNAVRTYQKLTDALEAKTKLPEVISMVDKLAKRNVIHKNKAANIKSKLALYYNKLNATA